jgi:glycerophosphoryl diester phosphodiesterase
LPETGRRFFLRDPLIANPYTINDEATMQRLTDLGSDGIISDDVDLVIEVARRNGL